MMLAVLLQTVTQTLPGFDWRWGAGVVAAGLAVVSGFAFKRIIAQLDAVIAKQEAIGAEDAERAIVVERVRTTLERKDEEDTRWHETLTQTHTDGMARLSADFGELMRRIVVIEGIINVWGIPKKPKR